MKQEFINSYGLLMSGTKPYVLRSIYRELTKDASCSRPSEEQEVDQRVQEVLSFEDMDIVIDIREMNEGREAKYELFLDQYTSDTSLSAQRYKKDVMEISALWQR